MDVDFLMVWAWMKSPMDGLAAWTWHDADSSDRESVANEGDGASVITVIRKLYGVTIYSMMLHVIISMVKTI